MIKFSTRPAPLRNRRQSGNVRVQHLLDVKIRTVTARRQRRERLATFFWRGIFLLVFCITMWLGISTALDKFFFSNPEYILKRITMELDGIMTREDVLQETGIREGENIFRIDLAAAEKVLQAIPQVAQVCIERHLPDQITITLQGRTPVAWIAPLEKNADPFSPENALLTDESGFLMKPRLIQPEFYHLPIIYGVRSDNIRDGEPLYNEDLRQALALLDEVAREPDSLLRIRSMDITKGYCIEVTSDRSARIVFGAHEFAEQLGRLRLLLEHCRETGRELDSVNLMVRRNTPVTFVMAAVSEEMKKPLNRTKQVLKNTRN